MRIRQWTRTLLLGAWLAGLGLPAGAASQSVADLWINGERIPGKSLQLVEQALLKVKFNTDRAKLRQGLVENHLLARAVEQELLPERRQELDALVEQEGAQLIDQVYGQRFDHDIRPFLQEPRALSAERLQQVLAPRAQGVVLNSLWLSEAQQREAAQVELIGWQFPDAPRRRLELLALYRATSVQGQVELQQGNLRFMGELVREVVQRDYLWYQLGRQGFAQAEQDGVRRLVRDKLVRHQYLHQIGLYSDFHHETPRLKAIAREVSDAEAQRYYQAHLEQYRNVASVQAAHIRLADQATADRVYAELQKGLDFAEAVRRHSLAEDKNHAIPGDLGLIRHDDPRLDFLRKAALIQKADSIAQPMQIEGAFEIVQVRSREDRQLPLSDPSVRFEVNQAVAREKLSAQFQARLDGLLAQARVEQR